MIQPDPDFWDNLLGCAVANSGEWEVEMLRVIAYDIADPKRLHRVAVVCADYGVRVQRSLFECWLDEPRFQELWRRLQAEIRPAEDRLLAYKLDAHAAKQRLTAGQKMICSTQRHYYIL